MKPIHAALVAALAAVPVLAPPAAGQSAADEEAAVRAALENYLRGHATGRGRYHRRVFHPVADLYWMRDGELQTRTSEAYIAGARGEPSEDEAERERRIVMVDVTGSAAVAKIVLDYPGALITDYMSLLKVDGEWKIVNKIFHVRSRPRAAASRPSSPGSQVSRRTP